MRYIVNTEYSIACSAKDLVIFSLGVNIITSIWSSPVVLLYAFNKSQYCNNIAAAEVDSSLRSGLRKGGSVKSLYGGYAIRGNTIGSLRVVFRTLWLASGNERA